MEILFLRQNSSSSSYSASTSLKKLSGCGLLTLGCLVYFSDTPIHGDSHRGSNNKLFGMVLLLGSSLLDSALTILESKLLFSRASPCHVSVVEAAFGFSAYGLLMLVVACMARVLPLETQSMPINAVNSVAFCICSSVAYALTFYFIASGGPAFSESFKVFRKIAVLVAFAFISSTALSARAAAALVLCCLGLYFVDWNNKGLPSVACPEGSLKMMLVSLQQNLLPSITPNSMAMATLMMMVLLSMSFLLGSPFTPATASHTTVSITAGIHQTDFMEFPAALVSSRPPNGRSFQCPVCPIISPRNDTLLFSQQYKLGGEVGKGTLGKVFKVMHLQTGNDYLIRTQNSSRKSILYKEREEGDGDTLSSSSPQSINCLEAGNPSIREHYTSRIAQTVWCGPNLMKLHDVVISDTTGEDVLIWELFDGQRIEEKTISSPPHARITRNITCKMLQALASLNCKGYAHNDVILQNLMYNDDTGEVRVIDHEFVGRSPCRQPRRLGIVALVARFGELLELEVDHKQDVWAAGILLSHLLFGNKGPFWKSSGKHWEDRIHQIVCVLGKKRFADFVAKKNLTRVVESEELWSALTQCPGDRVDWKQFDEEGRVGKDALVLLNAMLTYDPAERPSAAELLEYKYCREVPFPN